MGTQHSTSGRCRLDNEGDRRGMPSDLDGCVRSRRSLSLVRLPAEEISTTFETRCRRAKKSIPRTSVSSLGGEGFRLKVSLPVPALPLTPPPHTHTRHVLWLRTGSFCMRDRHVGLPAASVPLAVEADRGNEIAALCVPPIDAGFPGLPFPVPPSRFRSGAGRGLAGSLDTSQHSIQRGG